MKFYNISYIHYMLSVSYISLILLADNSCTGGYTAIFTYVLTMYLGWIYPLANCSRIPADEFLKLGPKAVGAWQRTPVIPALARLRQEDGEFETSPDYRVRHYLKKKKKE
jgi:hypothetical protein